MKGDNIMIVEKDTWFMNGYISSFVMIVLLFVAFLNVFHQEVIIAVISFVLAIILMTGLTIVQPNEIVVVQFLGMYIGTIRSAGWMMTIPLTVKTKLSRKVQRFETKPMYIKNAANECIQLSAVVTYQIVDAAKASFTVENFNEYIQLEAYILMNTIATEFLKNNSTQVFEPLNEELKNVLQRNVQFAGVEIITVYCLVLETKKEK